MKLKIVKSKGEINYGKNINSILFTDIEFQNCTPDDFTPSMFLYKEGSTFFFEKAHFFFNSKHNHIEFSPAKIRIGQDINKLIIRFEELKKMGDYAIILSYEIS